MTTTEQTGGRTMEIGECRNCYFFTKSREFPTEEGFCHRNPKIEPHPGCYWCGEFMRKYGEVSFYDGEEQEDKYTVVESDSHIPNYNLIDLDYPMYGTTVVKCGGRKFDLEVVRKALALAHEMNDRLAR